MICQRDNQNIDIHGRGPVSTRLERLIQETIPGITEYLRRTIETRTSRWLPAHL